MKIVLNKCYGGFSLSPLAIQHYLKLKNKEVYFYELDYETKTYNKIDITNKHSYSADTYTKDLGPSFLETDWSKYQQYYFCNIDIIRDDPDLVSTVETLGKLANGECSKLEIIEYNIIYNILNFDGIETINLENQSW